MSDDAERGLSVLRDIWHAQGQTSADLVTMFSHGKVCKAMRHIGTEPVDDDLRAAWRDRLEREGKLRPDGSSLRDIVLGSADERR
jgi:hypothetical protein